MATQRQPVVMPSLATSSLPARSPPPTDTRQTPVTVLDGEPVCTPEDEAAKKELKEETERQAWFQNEVNDRLDIPNGYLKVNVLIIRWHEDIDEFEGHNEEVSIQ
jgi:hypothetical protein